MALTDENGGMNTTMLVSPTSGMPYFAGNQGGFGGFGNGDGWWIILLFLLLIGNNGWGFGGGNNGTPVIVNDGSVGGGSVQRGFDQAAIMGGLNGIQSGVQGLSAQLCNCCADMSQTVNAGFANAETAANARAMANMQQLFGLQTQFADCCCENRLGIANLGSEIAREACADRAAVSDGIRDILVNQTANTQRILDQLCNDKIDAKNEKIADLERQLTMANLAASQTAQTSRILADNAAQTVALEQYLNPVPVPAYVVQNPNCCTSGCGCGCGA